MYSQARITAFLITLEAPMKIWATLLLTCLMVSNTMAEKEEKFVWRKLGPAMVEAQKTNKMILVDIYTDW